MLPSFGSSSPAEPLVALMLIVAVPVAGPVPLRSSVPRLNGLAMSLVFVSVKPAAKVVLLSEKVSSLPESLTGVADQFVPAAHESGRAVDGRVDVLRR